MSFSTLGWHGVAVSVLLLILGGCDVPTGDPSIHTETNLNTPVVANKTLVFLGGPESEFEPLIDTTSSTFDSLFVVGKNPKDVSIRQEIDDFGVSSLDEALDEAGEDLSVTNSDFNTNLIKNSEDLANQDIDASYTKSNQPYQTSDPDGKLGTSETIFDDDDDDEITVPFPAPGTDASEVFELPDFGSVNAQGSGATVDSVRLTDEETVINDSGTETSVNQIQFTLANNGSNTLRGKGGTNAPNVQIQDTEGSVETLRTADFGEPIAPGEEATVTLFVTDLVLDESTQYQLLVSGTDASNRADLTVNLSVWRYQTAFLSNAGDVEIQVSADSLSTPGAKASQFEGINVERGDLTLALNNQLSFDLEVGGIQLRNVDEPSFGDINDLNVNVDGTSFQRNPIPSGTADSTSIGMGSRGISELINASGQASPASSQIAVSADDSLTVSNRGTFRIQTLYFHPGGERVESGGTFGIEEDRVTFEEGDYVEVSSLDFEVNDLVLEPQAKFGTFSLTYPDLRRKDADGDGREYELDDALTVKFVENPTGKFEFDREKLNRSSTSIQVALDDVDVRVFPPPNEELEYTVRGRLEDNPDADAIVGVDDKVRGTASLQDLTIQELIVSGADPFNVEVTPNDDDNELDIAEDSEVLKASFDGFSGITDRVDGLQLASTNLDFSLATRNLTSTEARLYAAIQGTDQKRTSSLFLAGKPGTDRGVSSVPFESAFVEEGKSIPTDSLIQLKVGLENAELGEQLQQSKTIDNANSNVTPFINSLPTQVRFTGQVRVNEDGGGLKLRRPVEVDAGLTLEVPLQLKGAFVVRDTIDADFSSLEDLTDPSNDLSASEVTLQFGYENGLPLGADVQMTIADSSGAPIETFSGDKLSIEPAPKNEEGAAMGATERKTATLDLGSSREELQALAEGREVQLRLNMVQASDSPAAQLRADDTIRFKLKLDADASINTN